MKKGTRVMFWDGTSEGITIEDESKVIDSDRVVIRVKWDSIKNKPGSETIENVKDLVAI